MSDAAKPLAASAAVLAGGRATRFGSDKALALVAGRPIVARAADAVARAADEVFVVANDPAPYRFLGLPIVGDDEPGQGPLGGLATALRVARHRWLLVVACDMPYVNGAVARAILALALASGDALEAVAPRIDGLWHPLHACYHRGALDPARARLAAGRRSLHGLLDEIRTHPLDRAAFAALGGSERCLRNVNTPDDLARAIEDES